MNFFIFFLSFGILFIGELGDKTQLIVFNLSLEYKKSYKIGIGATIGFGLIVTIGLLFGTIITEFFPISLITLISGIVFILIGCIEIISLRTLLIERRELNLNESNNTILEENDKNKFSKLRKNPYLTGFGFIFLMELGDKTQILTITLTSIYPYPFEVWLGSFLALSCLAWMGVFLGVIIARKIPKIYLKVISILVFLSVGIITIFTNI
jgi:putative Ca2+/H+ antiporter (TMEM165/GDT1 family)